VCLRALPQESDVGSWPVVCCCVVSAEVLLRADESLFVISNRAVERRIISRQSTIVV